MKDKISAARKRESVGEVVGNVKDKIAPRNGKLHQIGVRGKVSQTDGIKIENLDKKGKVGKAGVAVPQGRSLRPRNGSSASSNAT